MTIIRSHCAVATYPKSLQTLPCLGKGANTNDVQGKRIITIQNYLDDPAIRALQEEIAKQYGKA